MTIAPPSEDREVVTSDGMVVDPLRAVHTVQGTVHFDPLDIQCDAVVGIIGWIAT